MPNNLLSGNPRFYLWLALAALLLLNYQAWMKDYALPPPAATQAAGANTPSGAGDLGSHIPGVPAGAAAGAAAPSATETAPPATSPVPGSTAATVPAEPTAQAAAPTSSTSRSARAAAR